MEVITIILSSLLTLISPVGLVADQLAAGLIRDRLYRSDSLQVRIDNVPNFQLLDGRIDRVRLAGRGLYPTPEFRIDTLDIETDPIDVDLTALRSGEVVLDQPFQAAAHLILRAEDINGLLRSPQVQAQLDDLQFDLPFGSARERNRYGLANPRVEFLADQRLRLTVDLTDRVQGIVVNAFLESGLEVVAGHQWVLLEPTLVIEGQPVPPLLINTLVQGIQSQLTLKRFEALGVTARVLQADLGTEALDLAFFVRVNPDSSLLDN